MLIPAGRGANSSRRPCCSSSLIYSFLLFFLFTYIHLASCKSLLDYSCNELVAADTEQNSNVIAKDTLKENQIKQMLLLVLSAPAAVRKGEELYQRWTMIKSRLRIPNDLKTGIIFLKMIHMLAHHYAELLPLVLFVVDVFWQRDIITSISVVGDDLGSVDEKMGQLLGSLIGRTSFNNQQQSRQSRNRRRQQEDDSIVIGLTVPPPQKQYYPWTGTNIIGSSSPTVIATFHSPTDSRPTSGSVGLWQEFSGDGNMISKVTQQEIERQQLDDDDNKAQRLNRRSVIQMAKRLWALSRFRLA